MAASSLPLTPPLAPLPPLAPAPGRMNVDFEERVDFARLRAYRLDRARKAMDRAGLGALQGWTGPGRPWTGQALARCSSSTTTTSGT